MGWNTMYSEMWLWTPLSLEFWDINFKNSSKIFEDQMFFNNFVGLFNLFDELDTYLNNQSCTKNILVEYNSAFCTIWATRPVLKISARIIFSWQNKSEIRIFVLFSIRTWKLINLQVIKISILALNYTFWSQNRLKMEFSNLNVLQDWVLRLVW